MKKSIKPAVDLGLGGPRRGWKEGPSDDAIKLSQPF